jgi:AcrR family transcriptional regulator
MTSSTDDTHGRLLRTASRLFTQKGYDAVSVREITAAAHVNLGAVSYHFGSKQALYHAAIESMAGPLGTLVAAIANSGQPPVQQVEAIVRGIMAHLLENPGAPVILLREIADDRPLPPPIAKLLRQNLSALTTILAAGQRDGSFRQGDPRLLAMTAMSQPFFVRAARRIIQTAVNIDPGAPDQEARITDHVVEGVLRSIARTPEVGP